MTRISTPKLLQASRKNSQRLVGPTGLLLSSSFLLTMALKRVVRWLSAAPSRLTTLATMESRATDSSSASFCTSDRVSNETASNGAGLPISYWLIVAKASKTFCRKPRSIFLRFRRRSRMASKNAFCSALLVARSAISNSVSSALSNSACKAVFSCCAALSRTFVSATGSLPTGEVGGCSGLTLLRCTTFASVFIASLLQTAPLGRTDLHSDQLSVIRNVKGLASTFIKSKAIIGMRARIPS